MNSQVRNITLLLAAVLLGTSVATITAPASAQDKFPTRAVELIVPWGPGGGADILGRLIALRLEAELKNPFPVINMPGASGTIGIAKMINSPPDGHSIAVLTADTVMAAVVGTPPWKMDQLVPLGVIIRQPSGLFVRQESRFRSWHDVVAEAKAKPGTITVAITGPGSPDEFTVNYLAKLGIQMVGVPYPKPAERFTAVLGGHADLLYEQAGDIRGFLDAKKLRPLIFFTTERVAQFPDTPAGREFGYDILLPQFRAIVTRADVDPKRTAVLAAVLEKFAASPEFAKWLAEQLALPDSFIAGKAAQAFIAAETEAMRRFAAALGGGAGK